MTNELKRLNKSTLYKQVGEALREYIISNNLKEGDRLPTEDELAGLLGVSRNSVREGIRYIETMGFIHTCNKTGIKVKEVNLNPLADMLDFHYRRSDITLEELYEARFTLEMDALELAIGKMNEAQLAVMEKSIEQSKIKIQNNEDINNDDYIFHRTIFIASKNKIICKLSDVLAEVFKEQINKYKNSEQKNELIQSDWTTIEEHKKIYDAMRRKDLAEAQKMMREHLVKYLA